MTRTREQLGLTETQAEIPINVGGEMWTLLDVAQHLYDARRNDEIDRQQASEIAAELQQLRENAREVGDSEMLGVADALEKSARAVLSKSQ
ncbi:hypothetical protein SAMN05216388_1007155 [Halorientalis persicus]|uniref:Uncharacterized protein n=1 Tax=Halorientalis persicus TaxID=1367881 RepID=A0A1H8LJB3_9EURY|nr:hypothetical protein [Halorientalis persicus]SEO05250.1 hypothetical protein SAMN05216388_1007155 [Halorientalis persicus]